MVKTKFKKAVSLMLAAVMSLTAFMGIFSMQSPQRMFTAFVALTLWWQQGQIYLRVLLGFLVLGAVPLPAPLGSVPITSHKLTASHI